MAWPKLEDLIYTCRAKKRVGEITTLRGVQRRLSDDMSAKVPRKTTWLIVLLHMQAAGQHLDVGLKPVMPA